MKLSFPIQLIDLFGRFRQLNSIVHDNWRDQSASSFFETLIDPINSAWSSYEKETNELLNDIEQAKKECASLQEALSSDLDYNPLSSSTLNNCGLFRFSGKRSFYTEDMHFLVAEWRLNEVLSDNMALESLAHSKHPGVTIIDSPSLIDQIRL